jgi:hypothetical protein
MASSKTTKLPPKTTPAQARETSATSTILVTALLAATCAVLLLQTIDLSRVDLGRHLKNGELLLHSSWPEKLAVLHRNFYSYPVSDFPFVNHHWLSGVVFYLVWRVFGFEGLTIFYMILISLSLALLFWITQRASSMAIAAPLAALAVPLVAWRAEVRPEGFTFLFIAVFYGVLLNWYEGRLGSRWLYWLPPLMVLWVNLHIGFVFGYLLIGMFFLKALAAGSTDGDARARKLKAILLIAALSLIAGALNPSFVNGLIYPLNIFRNYAFEISENQSLIRLKHDGLGGAFEYDLFEYLLALAAGSFVLRWIRQQKGHANWYPEALLLTSVGVLAILAVRNLPIFALLMIPIAAANLHDVISRNGTLSQAAWLRVVATLVFLAGSFYSWSEFQEKKNAEGAGLKSDVNATADFLKGNGITGPIFNDIDIGSYLIFHLVQPDTLRQPGSSTEKVYLDARPEAYPAVFLERGYDAALADEATWGLVNETYHFNAIVFSLGDAFAPVEGFLLRRAHDPQWAPVFADEYSLVFVRRDNPRNADVVRAHEIPQDRFRK